MSGKKIIDDFCKNLDPSLLNMLPPEIKEFFIDNSYTCLFQKYGNQAAAKVVLKYYDEIKELPRSFVVNTKKYGNIVYVDSSGKIVDKDTKRKPIFRMFTGEETRNMKSYDCLKRLGVVIIPVIKKEEIPGIRKEFINTLRNFPEYIRSPDNPDKDSKGNQLLYVLGGFAALGNPASFHNDLVRNMRKRCRKAVIPLFRELIDNYQNKELRSKTKLEMLFDRMMYRNVGQAPSPESWHRDVIPPENIEENDEIFGGWLNLDMTDQYFSCIPGSHLSISQKKLKPGFATIPPDQIKSISEYRHKFIVPPGHMIIFPQYIIHEVVSQPIGGVENMMRIFTGWRTTTSKECIHRDIRDKIKRQDVMLLPSGQQPPMFGASHDTYFRWTRFNPLPKDKTYKVNLNEWSENTFSKKLLIDYDSKAPSKKGFEINDFVVIKLSPSILYRVIEKISDTLYKIQRQSDLKEFKEDIKTLMRPRYKQVSRNLKSLVEYNFPMYREYDEEEISLYKPKKI
jgi:hypothetical protein